MPLRARLGKDDIYSFEYDTESWNELKSKHKVIGLLMPCCDSKAIPKTSKLGNFYFSHSKKAECNSVAESQEHLYVKGLVAKAAKDSGWEVSTEWYGSSRDGDEWIADVYCVKGKAKIAIEIQLSRQTQSETLKRQKRYKQSGVRCAWIASNSVFDINFIHSNKDIPFFLINKPVVGCEPIVEQFNIPLKQFICSLLSGDVSWIEEPWVYDIEYVEDVCWKCKKNNKQVLGYGIDVYGDRAITVPNASTVLEKIKNILNNNQLKVLGLNLIGKFETLKGNAPGFPYCNVCIHCGAPQNNYYLMEKIKLSYEENDITLGGVEYISETESSGEWVIK